MGLGLEFPRAADIRTFEAVFEAAAVVTEILL